MPNDTVKPNNEQPQAIDEQTLNARIKELKILQKEEELTKLEASESLEKKPISTLRKKLPFAGDENYQRGERSALGNIFERPGAANRSAVQSFVNPEKGKSRIQSAVEGYKKGSIVPEEVKRFQDMFLDKYWENYDYSKRGKVRDAIQVTGGFTISTAGLIADVITNPADLLLLIGGKVPIPKSLGGGTVGSRIAGSAIGKTTNKIANTPITVKTIQNVIDKTANVATKTIKYGYERLPKIMNENWFVNQKKSGMNLLKSVRNLRNKMFEVRNPYKSTRIDPNIAKKILMDSTLDVETSAIVNRLFGTVDDAGKITSKGIDNIDSIGKMYILNDILKSKSGAMHYPRSAVGKGGLSNPKIRSVGAHNAVKDAIYTKISETDTAGAQLLKKLDKDAGEIIYPYIKKLSDIFEASSGTEGVASTYALSGSRLQQGMSKAGHRRAIRKDYKTVNDLSKNYLKGNFKKDVQAFIKVAKQISKDMSAYRKRATEKAIGIGAATGIGAVSIYKLLGRNIGKNE